MTAWVMAAGALVALTALASLAVLRGDTLDRLVGLQLVGILVPLVTIALALATGTPVLLEVGLALAVLSFVGGLAYARFLERWL